jgi:site-specific DNA recombinase
MQNIIRKKDDEMTNASQQPFQHVALYARVSTDEQSKSGYSIPDQLRALGEYAEREGYTVVEEVIDDGYSGASPDRPGLERIMNLAESRQISAVIATKRDRFFRSRLHRLLFDQDLQEFGVSAVALNDTNNIIGDSVLDSFAEYERQQIGERTKAGKRQKARQGKVIATNQPSYGFRYNAARDGYEVDEDTMSVVRRIFDLVAAGSTLYSVVEILERDGVPSPRAGKYNTSGRWSEPMIRRIILSDVYKPHSHPEVTTLVTPEVASRLDDSQSYGLWHYAGIPVPVPSSGTPRHTVERARERIRNNRKASKASNRIWTLSGGILRCPQCGGVMEPHTVGRKNRRRHFYYRCRSVYNNRARACSNRKLLRAGDAEQTAWAFVSDLYRQPEVLLYEFDTIIERQEAALRAPDAQRRFWAARIVELDDKRRRAQDLAVDGLISPDELSERLSQIASEREEAQRQLEDVENSEQRVRELEAMRQAFTEFTEVVAEHLDSFQPDFQIEMYRYLDLSFKADDGVINDVSGSFARAVLGDVVGDVETSS